MKCSGKRSFSAHITRSTLASSSAGGFTDGLSGGTWALCGFRPVSSSNCIVVAAARERVRTDRPGRTGRSASAQQQPTECSSQPHHQQAAQRRERESLDVLLKRQEQLHYAR